MKKPKIKIKAEIGNILRGSGISNQFASYYYFLKTISKPDKRDSFPVGCSDRITNYVYRTDLNKTMNQQENIYIERKEF